MHHHCIVLSMIYRTSNEKIAIPVHLVGVNREIQQNEAFDPSHDSYHGQALDSHLGHLLGFLGGCDVENKRKIRPLPGCPLNLASIGGIILL